MSDWITNIVVIEKIEKHPNADRLDIATVLGDYPVIVRRDEYKVGDLACYLSIDTIVPDTEQFYFLCPKAYEKYEENGEVRQRQIGTKYVLGSVPEKYRTLKAKRILNFYSQGMLVELPSVNNPDTGLSWVIGDSVENFFPLKKAEEDEEDNITNAKKSKGANAAAPPKGWSIPYYDIQGLRKYVSCLKENEEIVLTEKIHGCNASYCFDGEKLWTKSRKYYKKSDPDDIWVDAAIRYNLEDKLSKYPKMVFFAELYGQIPKFRYDCELIDGQMHSKLAFFDIYNVETHRYLDYDDFVSTIKDIGLMSAPLLYRGKWLGKELMYPYAEGLTNLGGKHMREGFVLKTVKERFEPKLNSRMQIKLVGEGYNLQK
jgi:RNA ligase (TIGR02306 family)